MCFVVIQICICCGCAYKTAIPASGSAVNAPASKATERWAAASTRGAERRIGQRASLALSPMRMERSFQLQRAADARQELLGRQNTVAANLLRMPSGSEAALTKPRSASVGDMAEAKAEALASFKSPRRKHHRHKEKRDTVSALCAASLCRKPNRARRRLACRLFAQASCRCLRAIRRNRRIRRARRTRSDLRVRNARLVAKRATNTISPAKATTWQRRKSWLKRQIISWAARRRVSAAKVAIIDAADDSAAPQMTLQSRLLLIKW